MPDKWPGERTHPQWRPEAHTGLRTVDTGYKMVELFQSEITGNLPGWSRDATVAFVQVGSVCVLLALFKRFTKRLQKYFSNLRPVRLHPAELPPDVREYFQSQHPALLALGFAPAGDFQMVHGRHPCYTRFYLSQDEDVHVEVEVYRLKPQEFRVVVFGTVFEDGAVLYTGNLDPPAGNPPLPPQLDIRYRPNLSVSEQLRLHRADAAEYAGRKNVGVLCYPPEQLSQVSAFFTQYQRDYWFYRQPVRPPVPFAQSA